jgi:hypothetical protein
MIWGEDIDPVKNMIIAALSAFYGYHFVGVSFRASPK